MTEYVGTVHKVVEVILTWWQISLAVVGMLLGSYAWWLHQIFSTKAHTELCKVDLVQALADQKKEVLDEFHAHEKREDKRVDEYHESNTREHTELKSDVRWIREHLHRKNGDL